MDTKQLEKIDAVGYKRIDELIEEFELVNDRRYQVRDSQVEYTGGEYPVGGLNIFIWMPEYKRWGFMTNSPDRGAMLDYLRAVARLPPLPPLDPEMDI